MCSVVPKSINEKGKFNLIELTQLNDDTYTCWNKYNQKIKLITLKNKDKCLSIEKFDLLSKNSIIGIEKIIDFKYDEKNLLIITEIYNKLDLNLASNSIIDIGISLISSLEELYENNIYNFELNIDNISQNDFKKIIIKNIFIYSDNNNHIHQICIILEEIFESANNINLFIKNKFTAIYEKVKNNEIKNISELKKLLNEIKIVSVYLNNIKQTGSYSKNEFSIFNQNNLSYTNLINQIKSEKIVNFNLNIYEKNKFNNYDWLYQIENNFRSESIEINDISKITLINNKFTGILIIDDYTHIFLYEGFVIGSVNTSNNKKDNDAINNLKNITKAKIIRSNDILPILLKNIVSSGILIEKENYFIEELTEILNKLSELSFDGFLIIQTSQCKFHVSFINGNNTFILVETNDKTTLLDIPKFKNIIDNIPEKINIEVYMLNFSILDISLDQIVLDSYINIKYSSKNKKICEELLKFGNGYLPAKLRDCITNNIRFEKTFPTQNKLKLLSGELDLSILLENSIYYKFVNHLITELYFNLDKNTFKEAINFIYQINNVSFIKNGNSIRTIFKKDQDILFISEFVNDNQENFQNFIDEIKLLKKEQKNLIGAFYISDKKFSNTIINKYKRLTKLSTIDKITFKNKQKSYVKISKNVGFHLFILNYKNEEFRMYNPLLK